MSMRGRLFPLILALKCKCQGSEDQLQSQLGLSRAEFNGLVALDGGGPMSGCAFATRMGLSPSRGSRVLSRLVAAGYVKTDVSREDRRAVVVSLTAKGRRARQKIDHGMAACEERISSRLDRKRLQQVTEALELLNAVL